MIHVRAQDQARRQENVTTETMEIVKILTRKAFRRRASGVSSVKNHSEFYVDDPN